MEFLKDKEIEKEYESGYHFGHFFMPKFYVIFYEKKQKIILKIDVLYDVEEEKTNIMKNVKLNILIIQLNSRKVNRKDRKIIFE